MRGESLTRRRALRILGLGAAIPLLTACGVVPGRPGGQATPAAGQSSAKASGLQMPTYVPFQGPKADLPGELDGSVAAGYFKLPSGLVKSVTKTPGRNSTVSMMTWSVLPPPVAVDQNTWWQALNRQTGANLAIDIVSFADYPTRFQVMMAGNDLPDVITTPYGVAIPHLPDFVKSACADLTPFVTGDAIKQYPNLANFATDSWRTVVFGGRIYGVPVPYPPIISVLWAHQELLDQIGSGPPSNADDFKRILTALTHPDASQWGISLGSQASGGMAGDMVNGFFPSMFRAPNHWAAAKDGTLTSSYETDEFKAALGFYRDLFAAGVYHPDSPTFNSVSSRTSFQARKFGFLWGGIGSNNASQYMDKPPPLTPASKIRPLAPFAFDGGKPAYFLVPANHGFTVLKKSSDDRIRELLGVLDFLAAPFGSEEYMLSHYGVKDSDYTLDAKGNAALTEVGHRNDMSGFLQYLANPPYVLYNPANPDPAEFATVMQTADRAVMAAGVPDPTSNLYSPTNDTQGALLTNHLAAGMDEIIRGRRPLTDLDQLVKDWRSGGGDQIRKEFQQELASA
jgi:putative aldouronate transport system substrate-binding protein